jgi:hypothetical protein
MSDQITGNGASYPEDFTIPDDTDEATGANVNPAFEALAHRTEFLRTHGGAGTELVELQFLAEDNGEPENEWVVPAGLYWVWSFLVGGGGGGGAGATGSTTSSHPGASGGGGGGGAQGAWHLLAVTPGETLIVQVGEGGAGGSSAGASGSSGGATSITRSSTPIALAFPGSGGRGGVLSELANDFGFAPGGGPAAVFRSAYLSRSWATYPQPGPGDGGFSATTNVTAPASGSRSCSGQRGSMPMVDGIAIGGVYGTTDGSYAGGTGGGGGGSSSFGAGGPGGDGGNGNDSGSATAGAAGTNAPNAGGGGGGGGGGGIGSSGAGAHGNGGNGAEGIAAIYYPSLTLEIP